MRIVLKQFHDSVAFRAAARKPDDRPDDSNERRLPPRHEQGLTLIEMIVVLAIIAVVALMIVPNVIGRPDQARVTTTKSDMASIAGALKMYRLDNGDYPTTTQGLKALVEKPSSPPVPTAFPAGGYLEGKSPVDAWGHDYVYESNGGSFTLKSLGKDGKPGGEGVDADITQ